MSGTMNQDRPVLVTGGAGYIGSVTVERLLAAGHRVVVLDDLSTGHRAAVPEGVPLHIGDTADLGLLRKIADDHSPAACIHFAAFSAVGESVANPAKYMDNNVAKGVALFNNLHAVGIDHIVLSSTAAVYGEPKEVPIPEHHHKEPTNPYGRSKWFLEQILGDYAAAYDMRSVSLRYFNAAGATDEHGEHHAVETHLIPNVLAAAGDPTRTMTVFGTDYPTPDGTAVRDYIHVIDLAEAHIAALGYLADGGATTALNLGTGNGFSVLDIIETARRVTGLDIAMTLGDRRAGDPPELIADAADARATLGWEPTNSTVEATIASAWQWRQAHPDGYPD